MPAKIRYERPQILSWFLMRVLHQGYDPLWRSKILTYIIRYDAKYSRDTLSESRPQLASFTILNKNCIFNFSRVFWCMITGLKQWKINAFHMANKADFIATWKAGFFCFVSNCFLVVFFIFYFLFIFIYFLFLFYFCFIFVSFLFYFLVFFPSESITLRFVCLFPLWAPSCLFRKPRLMISHRAGVIFTALDLKTNLYNIS